MTFQLLLRSVGCALLLTGAVFPLTGLAAPSGGGVGFHHSGDGYLGVDFENLTSRQRAALHLASDEGVAVAAVDHDAPAGKAGLRSNDVIVKLNGKRAEHAEELRAALHKMEPGQSVHLDILRDGKPLQMNVVLADRKTVEQQAWSQHYTVPDPSAASTASDPAQPGFFSAMPSEIGKTFSSNGGLRSLIPGSAPYTGITLDVLTPQLATFFGTKGNAGLLVKSIDANSPASRAGLQAGDVIERVNDTLITSRSTWTHTLRQNRHDAVKLRVLRDRQPRIVILTFAETKS